MSNNHLRLDPIQLPDSCGHQVWYYEEANGIEIHWNNGKGSKGQAIIPWKNIRAAVKRKDKK